MLKAWLRRGKLLKLSFISFFRSKPLSTEALCGLSGKIPRFTKIINSQPVVIAIIAEPKMNINVSGKPIRAIRMSVSVIEFQGLAIKKVMT